MKNHVTGKNVVITDAIKAYVKEKLGKVASHYDQIQSIETLLSVIKNPSVTESHVAEVSCQIAGDTIRVEEKAESMYATIDLVADKLERQVIKYKEKHQRQTGGKSIRTSIEE